MAAGEGSRMRSSRPKPLHHLCGRPMVLHVIDALAALEAERIVVVVGHRGDWVTKALQDRAPKGVTLTFVEQAEQLGTGDAVAVGLTGLEDHEADVVVVPGDAPLLRDSTLAELVAEHRRRDAAATLLVAELPDPTGYGRVLRGRDAMVARVVEQRDATSEELAVHEIATSVYCFKRSLLSPALRRLHPTNAQGEYYLTDVVGVLYDAGHRTAAFVVEDASEVAGVNDRLQLAEAEVVLRRRINREWLPRGVTMWSPEHTYVDAEVDLAPDVVLLPGVVLKGGTTVASGAELGPDVLLSDTAVGERARVRYATAEHARIGADAVVGPFVELPPGTEVPPGATVSRP